MFSSAWKGSSDSRTPSDSASACASSTSMPLPPDVEGRHVVVDADGQRAALAHALQRRGPRAQRQARHARSSAGARPASAGSRGGSLAMLMACLAQNGFSRRVSR